MPSIHSILFFVFLCRGYDMEIEFSFGTLYAKEKKIKFEFNQSKLASILPESVETGFYEYDSANLAYNLDDEVHSVLYCIQHTVY